MSGAVSVDGAAAAAGAQPGSEAHPAHDGAFTCPNCATESLGEYCRRCGQKRLHDGDLSLRHAWHHLVHETLHVDGRLFTTLALLFRRPGQLCLDFIEGRRARHVHPVQLFLLFSAIFIAVAAPAVSLTQIMKNARQAAAAGAAGVQHAPTVPGLGRFSVAAEPRGLEARLRQKAQAQGLPYELYVDRMDARMAMTLKIVYALAIGANGIWLTLLFRRRFRYLAEHTVFALYWSCFGMAVASAGGLVNRWLFDNSAPTSLLSLVSYVYFLFAARRVYGGGWLSLALKGLVPMLMVTLIVGAAMAVTFVLAVI